MPMIKTGKRKQDIKISEATKRILRGEQEQLLKNENIIFEKEFNPDWVVRKCSRCFMTDMEREGDIFKCPKCELMNVPKGIILKIDKHYQMRKFLQDKIKTHKKALFRLVNSPGSDPRDINISENYIKKLQEELDQLA